MAGFRADVAVARRYCAAADSPWFGLYLDQAEALAWSRSAAPRRGIETSLASARGLRLLGDIDGGATGL
ncbi:MAG: hypothetical protein IPM11_11285 [Micropruina sp.]|nr:hypothetical protein [Micropruina sp.]